MAWIMQHMASFTYITEHKKVDFIYNHTAQLFLFLAMHANFEVYLEVSSIQAWCNCITKTCEPRHEKTNNLHMRKQRRRSAAFAVSAKLISAFVFATWIWQSLYFPNTKFPASSHLRLMYSLVCVRPGQNPHCWFSRVAAHVHAFIQRFFKLIKIKIFQCKFLVFFLSLLKTYIVGTR